MIDMLENILNPIIQSYGPLGLLVVMVIQTIIVPIPSEAVLMFAGLIGMKLMDILIYGGIGLIIGAIFAFYIGKYGGKPIIIKLVGKKWIDRLDNWVEKNGVKAILITRILPIIPFDLISYTAGLTSLGFKYYLIATIIGAFPRTLILALLGSSARGILELIGVGLEVILIIGIIGFIILAYLERKGYIDRVKDYFIGKMVKKKKKN